MLLPGVRVLHIIRLPATPITKSTKCWVLFSQIMIISEQSQAGCRLPVACTNYIKDAIMVCPVAYLFEWAIHAAAWV